MKNFVDLFSAWLQGKKRLLIITHKNPDGDALGSLFGLYHLLAARHLICHVHLAEQPPEVYRGLKALTAPANRLFIDKQTDVSSYDGVIVLDAAREDMPTLPNLISHCHNKGIPTLAIDHHPDNELYAKDTILVSDYAATAAIITALALALEWPISEQAATSLLLGVIRDTGGFRFQNTDATTMRLTASLMEAGGDYHGLMHRIFFSEKLEKLRMIGEVINSKINLSCNGRLLWVSLPTELFEQFDLHKRDMEGLIDALRVIRGVVITCVFTEHNGEIKLSMRSCDERYPVQPIAHQLGGGGHLLASGARLSNSSFQAAESKFIKLAERVLNGEEI